MADEGRARGHRDVLSRLLEIGVSDARPSVRLDRLLRLIARTAGAACAVVFVDDGERRTVAWRQVDGDDAAITGGWLDAKTRGRRGDDGSRTSFLVLGSADGEDLGQAGEVAAIEAGDEDGRTRTVEGPGRAMIGLRFRTLRAAGDLERRFPVSLSRAAAGLGGRLAREIGTERELAMLRRADEEQRTFVSVVAHELRTPLAALTGYLDLLTADSDGQFLSRSRDLVAGMSTLVADLLELSRLGAGQLHLELARFSAAEAAQTAMHDVAPLALQRGIVLQPALGGRLRTVHADRRRVQQVLVNLLANAVKFSHVGGRIAISLRFDGGVALYAIRDDGPGVAPEERERIFEPFHRAAGAERVAGTGLGLPIARDLARRMGGDVGISSTPGPGSLFVVALPATEATDRATVLAALERALRPEEAGAGPS